MNLHIETTRLILRPFTETDAELRRMARINQKRGEDTVLAVTLKENNEVIGFVGLFGIEQKDVSGGDIELCFNINDEYRGNGYELDAVKAMIWHAFEQAEHTMLSAFIEPENTFARSVLEKCGFIRIDTVKPPNEGKTFDILRLYHMDYITAPEWDPDAPFSAEKMGDFFTARVKHYDSGRFEYFKEQYEKLGTFISKTDEPLRILDIGCGSGIEYAYIWEKAPNAHITGVDLSDGMLNALAEKYAGRKEQWTSYKKSYFDFDYPENTFDIVVSNQTMHHFLPEQKLPLYCNLVKTLKPGGFYIECDFIVDEPMQKAYWARYERIMKNYTKEEIGQFHIDIPCNLKTQEDLLKKAGFSPVVVLEDSIYEKNNAGILRAEKPTL
jgi:tRNA (cmo5U34)-methyltransferase